MKPPTCGDDLIVYVISPEDGPFSYTFSPKDLEKMGLKFLLGLNLNAEEDEDEDEDKPRAVVKEFFKTITNGEGFVLPEFKCHFKYIIQDVDGKKNMDEFIKLKDQIYGMLCDMLCHAVGCFETECTDAPCGHEGEPRDESGCEGYYHGQGLQVYFTEKERDDNILGTDDDDA